MFKFLIELGKFIAIWVLYFLMLIPMCIALLLAKLGIIDKR